jgi:dTDP-4-amino-4,6-dideoxygalactose transaminase
MHLAIHGGKPIRQKPFPAYNTIGSEEKKAVERVLDSGVLSKYLGCWHSDFYGGPEVRGLEEEWADFFGVKHALAVNSNTSGLYCSVAAIGVEPGDEIVVPPYTMSATATAPLIFNTIPVFADIEADYFCLDAAAVEKRISPRTRALLIVDLFGLPFDLKAFKAIAQKHDLHIIEDAAQAPGAVYQTQFAGTLGDIGVFSLNYHKHIHCGEGGIVVTDSDELAERVQLVRNHGEAVVENKGTKDLRNMIGFNFRMTEIEAAIARCQLKKLNVLVEKRIENCLYLERKLAGIPCITTPKVRKDTRHVYYVHACKFAENVAGVERDRFIEAVKAELPFFELRESEGVKLAGGYVKPLYLQPIFQEKTAYGSQGFPFNAPWVEDEPIYARGICPVCEALYEKELFTHEFIVPSMNKSDLDDVADAFEKVWENRNEI